MIFNLKIDKGSEFESSLDYAVTLKLLRRVCLSFRYKHHSINLRSCVHERYSVYAKRKDDTCLF